MNEIENRLIAQVCDQVKHHLQHHFGNAALCELASVDHAEALARALASAVAEQAFALWAAALESAAVAAALSCPGCGHARKVKRRTGEAMQIRVLGLTVAVPKPYLECGRCESPGVSISALLTGLTSGTSSSELKLRAGYAASQHSYGKARRDLEVHYGETVERTGLRRMALEVEAHAKDFAERSRVEALAGVEQECQPPGIPTLMLQADGGVIRTGTLVPCVRGDRGFEKQTAKRKTAQRKRLTQFRELITFDVREPGASEASALDVMVPVHAPDDERARRMLALAARSGLGEQTEVVGLGDMGSSLPAAFAEAFVGHPKSRWYTDWHHVCDYVHKTGEVLVGLDVAHWRKRMREALWKRDERERDRLLRRAHKHRVKRRPDDLEKCPLAALETYVRNSWDHIRPAELKERGLDFVSARAEAQVRVRTHGRFDVPGAWRSEHIEGKATLRAIIDEGRWANFRADYLRHASQTFDTGLSSRLEQARAEGRLTAPQIATFYARPTDSVAQRKAA